MGETAATGPGDGVVVGVDGTTTALRAVEWAAAEAAARRTSLRIVHAAPYATNPAGVRRAAAILGRAYTLAHRREPGVPTHTVRVTDAAVPALVEATRGASLLVIGMLSGHPGDDLVSSMAPAVVATAPCPVTVVRAHHDATDLGSRPVVVGIEGTVEDAQALDEAFADAARHGSPLVVVHAAPGPDDADLDVRTAAALREALGPWTRRHPAVPVEVRVGHNTPATELLHLAVRARVVVVGTRGRGRAVAALLGSTSRIVLSHGGCPVTVVRRAAQAGDAVAAATGARRGQAG